MNRSLNFRALLVVVVVLLSVWRLYPTWQSWRATDETRTQAASDPALQEKIDGWDARAIRKGLDLEGGMYIVLEIDTASLTGGRADDAMERAVKILRNRIDQFGVSEPEITPMGDSRIIVQLPGLQDPERAKRLNGSTARLEFRLVRTLEDTELVLRRLDEAFRATVTEQAAAATPETPVETAAADEAVGVDDELGELPFEPAAGLDDTPMQAAENPFLAYLVVDEQLNRMLGTPILVPTSYVTKVQEMLAAPEARVVPRDMEFQFGMAERDLGGGLVGVPLFLVDSQASVTGDNLNSARSAPDPDRPGNFRVSFSMDNRGARMLAKLTSENVGRMMAICLDGKIKSAPQISTKIPSGDGDITGAFSSMQAQDLALLLNAGALPVDLTIEEERTISPTLGADSVREGLNAGLYGLLLVVVFVVIYYRVVGLAVVAALIVNLLMLLAVLAQFGLVLTLPGIAGIILTIGMAVDANVLINERIREELRRNKTARAAVDAGFSNATRTIVDANVTTLIAAAILLWFGTGPIKGFAVTLSIGILSSMFTALVMTRVILEAATRNRANAKLII
jgi:protein-export membrane protein SecD